MTAYSQTVVGAQRYIRGELDAVDARSPVGVQGEPSGALTDVSTAHNPRTTTGRVRSGAGTVTRLKTLYRWVNGSQFSPSGLVSTQSRSVLGASDQPSGTVSASLYKARTVSGTQPSGAGTAIQASTFHRTVVGGQPQHG